MSKSKDQAPAEFLPAAHVLARYAVHRNDLAQVVAERKAGFPLTDPNQ
jgi:hypothetical protein